MEELKKLSESVELKEKEEIAEQLKKVAESPESPRREAEMERLKNLSLRSPRPEVLKNRAKARKSIDEISLDEMDKTCRDIAADLHLRVISVNILF